jgi:transcriptional regulator with XRE-family HTH domain
MARRRPDLAEFLRSRRQRLTPTAAGLPSGRRRKTPGLRREEVAELAGIGSGWYTFLEQGRDVRPSEGALFRIARALKLNRSERKYLLNLALESPPRSSAEEVIPPVVHLVATTRLGLSCRYPRAKVGTSRIQPRRQRRLGLRLRTRSQHVASLLHARGALAPSELAAHRSTDRLRVPSEQRQVPPRPLDRELRRPAQARESGVLGMVG